MLECPVCLELPRNGPIYGCRKGHHLCQACVSKVKGCPVCREPDVGCRNLLAEKVVEVTLQDVPIKCRWSNCDFKLLMGSLGDHEKFCPHREIPCASSYRNACDWRGPLSKLIAHVREKKCVQVLFDEKFRENNFSHPPDAAFQETFTFKNNLGDFPDNAPSVFTRNNVITHWKPIVLLSKHLIIYWLYLIVQRDQKGQWILMLHTMMPQSIAKKITAKISVTSPSHPERAHVFEGHPISFELPREKALETGAYLLLADSQVKPLKYENQVFSYSVDIKTDPDFEAYRRRLTSTLPSTANPRRKLDDQQNNKNE